MKVIKNLITSELDLKIVNLLAFGTTTPISTSPRLHSIENIVKILH